MPCHKHWNNIGSQAAQDIVQRIEKAYQLFFENLKAKSKRKVRPPSFRKYFKYQSFTLKQASYSIVGNKIIIQKQQYRFFESRELVGTIKTFTVKRDSLGDIYFIFVTDANHKIKTNTATTIIAGGDFGLKTYLTLSDGSIMVAPEPFKKSLKKVKKANRKLSRKKAGSNNRAKAKKHLARVHKKVKNQRKDFHFKAALDLVRRLKNFALEDLNLEGMKALWGKKVSDLGFADFVKILEFMAMKNSCRIVKIDRWYPSSKKCHCCGTINEELKLKDRVWFCHHCKCWHDRDFNAAINIERVGSSTLGLGNVSPEVAIPLAFAA
jgi:putative transposase